MVEPSRLVDRRYAFLEPLAWTATAGIVAIDVVLPPGFAVGILYIGVVLAGLWVPRRRFLLQYAIVASGLEVVGLLLPAGGIWTMGVFNRGLSIGALWITAAGIALYGREAAARDAVEVRLREQAAMVELGKMAAAVAHEVRNALTGVSASLQLLTRTPTSGVHVDGDLGALARARLAKLEDTVTDLLAFAEARPIAMAPVSLRMLIQEAADMALGRSEGGHATLSIDVPDIVIAADHDALRRALFNLMLNGLQATPPDGEVTVRAGVRDGRWQLELADEGPGIQPAARARLFEPFFSTKTHGVGLGLAFAKRIVSTHHGTIDITCPPGGGTVATLDMPV